MINLVDRFSSHKLSFFTDHEITLIKSLKFEEGTSFKQQTSGRDDGAIGKLCKILLRLNPETNFAYWIVNMLSSLSRNLDVRFTYWITESGVFDVYKSHNDIFYYT